MTAKLWHILEKYPMHILIVIVLGALMFSTVTAGCAEEESETFLTVGVLTSEDIWSATHASTMSSITMDSMYGVTVTSYDLTINTNAQTVQTVTNVVEEWFCDKCYEPRGYVIVCDRHTVLKQDGMMITTTTEPCPKTIKRVQTTIKRIYTLTLKWKGKTRTLTHEEIESETVKAYRKKENWEEVKK